MASRSRIRRAETAGKKEPKEIKELPNIEEIPISHSKGKALTRAEFLRILAIADKYLSSIMRFLSAVVKRRHALTSAGKEKKSTFLLEGGIEATERTVFKARESVIKLINNKLANAYDVGTGKYKAGVFNPKTQKPVTIYGDLIGALKAMAPSLEDRYLYTIDRTGSEITNEKDNMAYAMALIDAAIEKINAKRYKALPDKRLINEQYDTIQRDIANAKKEIKSLRKGTASDKKSKIEAIENTIKNLHEKRDFFFTLSVPNAVNLPTPKPFPYPLLKTHHFSAYMLNGAHATIADIAGFCADNEVCTNTLLRIIINAYLEEQGLIAPSTGAKRGKGLEARYGVPQTGAVDIGRNRLLRDLVGNNESTISRSALMVAIKKQFTVQFDVAPKNVMAEKLDYPIGWDHNVDIIDELLQHQFACISTERMKKENSSKGAVKKQKEVETVEMPTTPPPTSRRSSISPRTTPFSSAGTSPRTTPGSSAGTPLVSRTRPSSPRTAPSSFVGSPRRSRVVTSV